MAVKKPYGVLFKSVGAKKGNMIWFLFTSPEVLCMGIERKLYAPCNYAWDVGLNNIELYGMGNIYIPWVAEAATERMNVSQGNVLMMKSLYKMSFCGIFWVGRWARSSGHWCAENIYFFLLCFIKLLFFTSVWNQLTFYKIVKNQFSVWKRRRDTKKNIILKFQYFRWLRKMA